MEKRVLLAVVLSFLVLFGYQMLVVQQAPPPKKSQPAAASKVAPAGGTAQSVGGASAANPASEAAAAVPSAEALVADAAEREIVVETQSVRAVFTNRGAHLTSWKLKKYLDLQGRPQELVPQNLPKELSAPFELKVDDEVVTARLANALYRPDTGDAVELQVTDKDRTITFEFKDSSGLAVRKVFRIPAQGYTVGFEASVQQGSRVFNPTVLWGPGLGDIGLASESSSYTKKAEGVLFHGEKVQRLDVKAIARQPVNEGDYPIAGIDDHYFMSVAFPKRTARLEYRWVTVPGPGPAAEDNIREYVDYGIRQAKGTDGLRFFFGPKDFDVLAGVDRRLVRVINFGIFDWLAVPLLRGLKWVNGYAGNYGWSIIILTVLITLAMFPLRHRSMVSMRKMQELQPEIKAIQDRYSKYKATDPERQKMNREVMDLYKSRGVNPAGGCLPILLTMPVLFAFYSLLSAAIELRGQPWIGWITDLSVHDPIYVTPILAGATQWFQMKISPSTGDPVQAKMMLWMMPAMFTAFFLWAPSGLTIYMLASNILGIAQQIMTNRMIGPMKVPAKAAAERKKA